MDDLDHSVHISECDWKSFCEESEECSLQQPSLACLDDPNLSDSENSGDLVCPLLDIGQFKFEQVPADIFALSQVNTEGPCQAEKVLTECAIDNSKDFLGLNVITEIGLEVTKTESGTHSLVADVVKYEDCLGMTVGTTHVNDDPDSLANIVNIILADGTHSASVGDISESIQDKGVGAVIQSESGTSSTIPAHLNTQSESPGGLHTEPKINLCSTVRPVSDKCSDHVAWTEKERWFVTVNDRPAQKHSFTAPSVKKKRRKKKLHRIPARKEGLTDGQDEPLPQCLPQLEKEEDFESEGEYEMENLKLPYVHPGAHPSPPILGSQEGLAPESHEMLTFPHFGKKESASPKLTLEKVCNPSECPTDSYSDINKCHLHDTNGMYPVSTLNDTSAQRDDDSMLTENLMQSEELENEVEFFSTNSYDSDDYLSAAELMEECKEWLPDSLNKIPHISINNAPRSISLTSPNSISLSTTNVTDTKEIQMYPNDVQDTPSNGEAAYSQDLLENPSLSVFMQHQNEGYQSTADQAYNKPSIMPNDTLMHADNTSSSTSRECTEIAKIIQPLAGCGTAGPGDNSTSLPPPPEVTVTNCSLPSSPETYVNALSHPRPVYAISAFWDEMEKLTIKDILQLRIARSPSPGEMLDLPGISRGHGEATYANVLDRSLSDTAEYILPDSTLVDVSDNADSDYFTHLDDSKPDRSSCEFSSLSDFDEECLRFIGASTNPSPEPQDLKPQCNAEFPSVSSSNYLQEGDIHQTEQGTSFDVKQLVQQTFEDIVQTIGLPSHSACQKGLTKSKSMHNVQNLCVEIELKDAALHSVLEEEEQSTFLSNCQALERSTCMRMCDTVTPRTRTPPPILANVDVQDERYQISFPEVFGYLFTEAESTDISKTVTVYDSKSVSNEYCQEGSDMVNFPLKTKTISIFSSSPSSVRDVTFPELDNSKEGHRKDKSPFSMRRFWFPCKGSSWCRRSGAWVYTADAQVYPAITLADAEKVTSLTPQVIQFGQQIFRDLAERQRKFNSLQNTVSISNIDGMFFKLKHSDLCLVCIAFASWVLRSSNPQSTDAWKAALLANVSAISAIQYLRRKGKKHPHKEKP